MHVLLNCDTHDVQQLQHDGAQAALQAAEAASASLASTHELAAAQSSLPESQSR